jgi:nicotinate-nucleotide adenylyltransferase
VQQVVPESAEGAVDVPDLPALVAMRPDQLGTAVEALALAIRRRLTRLRLDRARHEAAGDHSADAFDLIHAEAPLSQAIMPNRPSSVEGAFRSGRTPCYRLAMIKTGLLGGSFNPAHRGHRRISINAARALGLDEVWWLVSPGNPLKDKSGMAPLAVRVASAKRAARGLPVRVSAIEARLGTRYTVDTLAALRRRYPRRRFVWLMGSDNLADFHNWRDWRKIATLVPIAVVSRPGYDRAAQRAVAMGWLRRFVRPAGQARSWTEWRLPSLVLLQLPLDLTSATGLRAADPNWHKSDHYSFNPLAHRDGVTRRLLA